MFLKACSAVLPAGAGWAYAGIERAKAHAATAAHERVCDLEHISRDYHPPPVACMCENTVGRWLCPRAVSDKPVRTSAPPLKRFAVSAHYTHGGIMRFAGFTLALAGIFAGNALGQAPTVGGLLNNYSNTLPGLPNYGIAQGS